MNKITETQRESIQLKRLAAQRQLYTDAKNVQKIQVFFSILVPPILAVCVKYLHMPPVYAACYGIILALFSVLWFVPRQRSLKKEAVGIQELFDCDVLELAWREIVVGPRLGVEIVEKYASKHMRKDRGYLKLKDWYAKDVGRLPLHLGRLACQRENCLWDAQLRRRYAGLIRLALVILAVLALFFGLIGGFSLENFILAVVLPLLPAFILGIQWYKEHTESATRGDYLRKSAAILWEKALEETAPEELTCDSHDLQNAIYDHRQKSPLILDMFYNHFKEKDEELMNKTAGELAKEACVRLHN